jgi:hypothetical protein
MPAPLGLRLKARLVVMVCQVALAFVSDAGRTEALTALRRNYELLAGGGK